MARRIHVSANWSDLVLGQEATDRIKEFIGRSKHAHRVFSEWGFGQRLGYGKGMIALFSGPPGTGKTMLAGIISKELDLDVYQVDLAQVVSKWVGETEKQLGRVFDQAERAHAVLLFDEADSLFAKRTEVKSSNDRYGNLAVNYLLQRLEAYSGVVVMTTNKEASLDEALQRRLSLHLHLDIPEVEERERLWRSMLPSKAPSARNINFKALAKDYEISGGYIKNVALRAAFLAAETGIQIHMGLLRRAAALELEDMGRLVSRQRSQGPGRCAGLQPWAGRQGQGGQGLRRRVAAAPGSHERARAGPRHFPGKRPPAGKRGFPRCGRWCGRRRLRGRSPPRQPAYPSCEVRKLVLLAAVGPRLLPLAAATWPRLALLGDGVSPRPSSSTAMAIPSARRTRPIWPSSATIRW